MFPCVCVFGYQRPCVVCLLCGGYGCVMCVFSYLCVALRMYVYEYCLWLCVVLVYVCVYV